MQKATSVIAIVIGILILCSVAAPSLINAAFAMPASSSIGIIGGADGPTAVMVTSTISPVGIIVAIVIGIVVIALGIWGLKKAKK